jgi:ribosome modulation factor
MIGTPSIHSTKYSAMLTRLDDPFQEGYDSYENGLGIEDNPYPQNTAYYDAWLHGWLKPELENT